MTEDKRRDDKAGTGTGGGVEGVLEDKWDEAVEGVSRVFRCLLSLLSSCVNATNPRPTVLSTASQGRACGPSPKGLPLLHLSQACKWSTQVRWEGVWLWCAHPLAGADPVIIGEAQPLNGQGHAANRLKSSLRASLKPEDARRCATVCNPNGRCLWHPIEPWPADHCVLPTARQHPG